MAKKNFLLLSLDDSKAKKIANAVNNETGAKILDFLADREATETEIAKELKLAASTVSYNLKQLLDAKLVVWEKSHLSNKGKEVKNYTVANRYIIIAPKGSSKEDFLEKVKHLFPAFIFLIFGSFVIYLYDKFSINSFSEDSMSTMMLAYDGAQETGLAMAKTAAIPVYNEPHSFVFWFFLGGLVTIIFLILYQIFFQKK